MPLEQHRREISFSGDRGVWGKFALMIAFEPKTKGWTGIQ